MAWWKAILAAFIGGILAGVVLLAWRASQETQKSIPESFADVPAEAKKVYVEARSKATDAAHKATDAATDAAHKATDAVNDAVKKVRERGAEAEEEIGDWPDAGYVAGGPAES